MGNRKYKILYFYITHALEGFQGFNIHIMEFMNHANAIDGIEVIGAYELAKEQKNTIFYLRLFHKIKKYLPRFISDCLAIFSNIPDLFYALKKIKEYSPDIILFRHNHMKWYQNIVRKITGIPMLLEVNAPLTLERIQLKELALKRISFLLEKWSWQTADRIYVVSNALKNILSSHVNPEKIVAIHNGVNKNAYTSILKEKRETIIIGYAGSFRKYHGIDILFSHVIPNVLSQYPQVTFLLVGTGGVLSDFQKNPSLTKELMQRVILPGHIRYHDLPEYISKMDITFMMDFTEYGSPLKLFEYMMARTCIIVPDRKPIREIIEDGKDGLFFKPRDESDFMRCLSKVLSDESFRDMLALNAYEKVINNYTWDHNAKRVVEVLKSISKKNE